MSADEASKRDVSSVTSSRWFVAGGVVSLVSALALAWKGTVCVDVLKILLARDLSELTSPGQRLGRVSWCPLGIAVGTTLIAAELLAATAGLGYVALNASRMLDTDVLLVAMLLIGILGGLLSAAMQLATYVLAPWSVRHRAGE